MKLKGRDREGVSRMMMVSEITVRGIKVADQSSNQRFPSLPTERNWICFCDCF